MGWGALPWAVMGEMFASNVKAKATGITVSVCWFLAFLITKFSSNMEKAFGNYALFWMFGAFCIISIVFTVLLLPETKGKSLQEIQDELNGVASNLDTENATKWGRDADDRQLRRCAPDIRWTRDIPKRLSSRLMNVAWSLGEGVYFYAQRKGNPSRAWKQHSAWLIYRSAVKIAWAKREIQTELMERSDFYFCSCAECSLRSETKTNFSLRLSSLTRCVTRCDSTYNEERNHAT